MKIQIDTTAKTISVEDDIKFSDLIKNLNLLFPKKEWMGYNLKVNVVINNWCNPITYTPTIYYDKQPTWRSGEIICGSSVTIPNDKSFGNYTNGIYCLEVRN